MSKCLFRIELLGTLSIRDDTQLITHFRTQKTGVLIATLALNQNRIYRREELMEMLWPGEEIESARNRLRLALSALRHLLENTPERAQKVVLANRLQVQLNPAAYLTDKAEFEDYLEQAQRLQEPEGRVLLLTKAIDLYQGDLLLGCEETWITGERQRLADMYLGALRQLIKVLAKGQRYEAALEYARRAVGSDPLREESHRVLMQLYTAMGRPAAALRQYRNLETLLLEELNVRPSATTRELAAQLTGSPNSPAVPNDAKSVSTRSENIRSGPASPRASLSSQTLGMDIPETRFLGREAEIVQICEMLATPETRLVSLTGLGGCGKTRLALAIAQRHRIESSAVVCFTPLAPVNHSEQIIEAIVQSLPLPASCRAVGLERIIKALAHKETLLVLDNFEHLMEGGVPLVQTLLHRLPLLTCLVTSRQSLRLSCEQEFPVEPLPIPKGSESIQDLMALASVQIFMDRARAVRPSFVLQEVNAEHVATVCRLLEGLPLAIELAAAWAQTLTPSQMIARLAPRLSLLVSRYKDIHQRHSSLRAVLDASYQALPDELQPFFAALSVFSGGWTLEAAEEIFQEPSALDYLTQLRERSLLILEDSGLEMRFSYLEIVREYAQEQLLPGQKIECARRHADYFLRYAERAEPHLRGHEAPQWLSRLEREQGNFRVALANEELSPEMRLRLAGALWRFWYVHSYHEEGYEWLQRTLRASESSSPALRLKAHGGAGNIAYNRWDYANSTMHFQEVLRLARQENNIRAEAASLGSLGNIAIDQAQYEQAHAYFQQSLAIFEQQADTRGTALTLANLANLASRQADDDAACKLFQKSLMMFRSIDDKTNIAIALNSLADLLIKRDADAALILLRESLILAQSLGSSWCSTYAVETLAALALHYEKPEQAALLLGAADADRAAHHTPLPPHTRLEHEQRRALLQERLSTDKYEELTARGNAFTWKETLIAAQNVLNTLQS